MKISMRCEMSLAELIEIVSVRTASETPLSQPVEIDALVDAENMFDALEERGLIDDWADGRNQTSVPDLRDAIAEVRRGNVPMALILFARIFTDDSEMDAVEGALRAPALSAAVLQ